MDHSDANNADEWEEGSLPAAPMVPFFTQQDFVDVVPQSRSQQKAVPSRFYDQRTRANDPLALRTTGSPGRFNSPGNSPIADHEPTSHHPEIVGIASRRGGIKARQAQRGSFPVDNAAYSSYARREQHGGEYTFSQGWEQLLLELHGEKTRLWARDELNRLSRQTSTFIATPRDVDNTVLIWGDRTQVAYAQAGLEEFEKSIRKEHAEKRKDLLKWEKVNALDARKEHREERKAKFEEIIAQHGKLESSADYGFEFWLLWPSQELDFEQISSSKLQGLRMNFRCVIDYDSTTSFVRVMANEERSLLQVIQRIVNLVKELIAELNQVTKANLLQLPSKSTYGSSVRLEKNESMLAIPELECMNISIPEEENRDRLRGRNKSNRKVVGKALEKCLKSLRLSEKHVRMRVNLGQLAFKQYQLPSNGSGQYRFDDFCTMVKNDRTILQLQGLPVGTDTDTIVDRCASHPMFLNPTETYSVQIDFAEPNKPTTLRLEKAFSVSAKDVFDAGHRWLEFPSGSEGSLLEVNMLDFENLDWEMTINSASFPENVRTSKQLDSFQTNVMFKPAPNDELKGKPKRRVFYRSGGPNPVLVTELTTITYDVRDTDAKLELTRKDEYEQTQYGTQTGPPISRLFASYFYPNWDNLLGAYASLQPGEQVDWQPSLSTFFPDATSEGKPKGLKKFLEEVKQIQQVLGGKIPEADDNPTKAQLIDLPDGVGNANRLRPLA